MAGKYTEPGGPPESEGRNPGGPADRDWLGAEHREDPRIPFEARRDDVRRDREGHGPAATGGQHRDAGTPPAEMGRQEGHQEGGQRSARPLVSTEPAVGRHPGAHRPGRAGEDRPDRGEPQEAQDVRVGSSVRTPIWDATTTAWAIFRNRPWPTTPGMPEIRAASFTGPRIGPKCASRMWFPLSVRNGSPACLRNSTFAPRPSSAADAFFQPNGWTSTGNGVLVPRRRTSFASSTITTNFFDAFDGSPVTPDQYFRGSDTTAYEGISFFPGGLLPFTRSGRAVIIREVSPAPAWPSPSGRMPCDA